jgi:gliding motility-associated-like protein
MCTKTTWYSPFIILSCLFIHSLQAQPVTVPDKTTTLPAPPPPAVWRTASTEICNNNTDDDGNGLTDQEDFGCYFSTPSSINCGAGPIIWACNGGGNVYWINLVTRAQQLVATTSVLLFDIAWAADGKLYGMGGNPAGIWEIDPNTGQTQFRGVLPDGYIAGNSMTADAFGNLYLDVHRGAESLVIKLNIANWEACPVADLRPASLFSAGDLTFLNGDLYLSCTNNIIAKINIQTGETQVITVKNATTTSYYGLTNTGDGNLYVCDFEKIYRLDPKTMTVTSTAVAGITGAGNLFGLATYPEVCQGPKCPFQSHISATTKAPYCNSKGVTLVASNAACNRGNGTYEWITPSGARATGDKLQAIEPGTYYLDYQTSVATCRSADSFTLQFLNAPTVKLNNDTSICEDDDVYLYLMDTANVDHYTWEDGSNGPTMIAPGPGVYWVEAGNACGVARDTINISAKGTGCEHFVTVPTAFSPNGDGRNDVFKPVAKGNFTKFEFTVYNRWGQIVFKTNEINRGWDGTMNGFAQSAGLFTWICRYQLKRKEPRTIKGTVTVIR